MFLNIIVICQRVRSSSIFPAATRIPGGPHTSLRTDLSLQISLVKTYLCKKNRMVRKTERERPYLCVLKKFNASLQFLLVTSKLIRIEKKMFTEGKRLLNSGWI